MLFLSFQVAETQTRKVLPGWCQLPIDDHLTRSAGKKKAPSPKKTAELFQFSSDFKDFISIFVSNVRLGFCGKLNDESRIELMRIF